MNLGREKNPCPVFHPFLLPSSWKFIESAFCPLLSLSGIVSPFVPQTVSNLNYELKLPSAEKQPDMPSLVSLPLLCVLLGPGLSALACNYLLVYYFSPSDCELPEDRICGSLIFMFQCLAQCRQLLNVWMSEWANKWMNHWRRALPVIVLNGSLSRVYPPGGRDCFLYSMCRTELCLLFRLIGGKSFKNQEHLAPPLPIQAK